MSTIGKKMRTLREQSGISQIELGERAGHYVSKYACCVDIVGVRTAELATWWQHDKERRSGGPLGHLAAKLKSRCSMTIIK